MWYLISFLCGFVLGGVSVIAAALLWPDDDDDDDDDWTDWDTSCNPDTGRKRNRYEQTNLTRWRDECTKPV